MTENTSKNSPKQKPFHINSNHSFTMRMGEGAYTLGVQLVLPENKTMKIPYMDSRLRFFLLFSLFTYYVIMVGGRGVLEMMMVDD